MNSRVNQLLHREMTRKEFLAFGALAAISVFGFIGVIEELLSHAATPYATNEAENGTRGGTTSLTTATGSASTEVVEFGTAKTTTPPPTGMNVGVCVGYDAQLFGASDGGQSQYAAMKKAGFNLVREECSYNSGNSPSTTAQPALNAGLDVLMILDAPGSNVPDIGTANFVSFCQAMVNYWKPKGIHKYEILNEPNTSTNWNPNSNYVNPAAYAALLKACYSAIKTIDPTATVLTGGVATFADSDGASAGNGNYVGSLLPNTWMTLLYQALGGNSTGAFDAVALHPYTWPAAISSTSGNWSQAFGTSNSARTAMVANGDSAKSIWITEMGWPTSGTGGDVSESQEASYLGTALSTAKGLGYVSEFIVFNWNDDTDGGFGVVDSSYNQKPAYATVVDFIASN